MRLREIVEKLDLRALNTRENLDREVNDGYTGDLLSDVIANSQKDSLWITLQIHQNIIAVAKLKDLAGIIITNNRTPEEETVNRAREEDVPLMVAEETSFVVSGRLYQALGHGE